MPLVYVTGVAGAGKSTVQNELARRGFDARDLDSPAISGAYDLGTGLQVAVPNSESRPDGWFQTHPWRTHPGALQRIRHVADNDLVFLCGTSTSEVENDHAYDTLICLDIDEATLRDRLSARDGDNDFGKAEHEMQQILEWRKGAAAYYETLGGHIVDATMPVHQVVDEIVRIAAATS